MIRKLLGPSIVQLRLWAVEELLGLALSIVPKSHAGQLAISIKAYLHFALQVCTGDDAHMPAVVEFGGGCDREHCPRCGKTIRILRQYSYTDEPSVFPHGYAAWRKVALANGRYTIVSAEDRRQPFAS